MTSQAEETCLQALNTNHEALNTCVQVIDKKDALIDQYQVSQAERDKLLASTQASLREEQEAKNSLLRNPVFLIGLGLVVGVAITK